MRTLVIMPPQHDLQRRLPASRVVVPETEAAARHELLDAAAYGGVPPARLPIATKLRWLHDPQAGPAPGYDSPTLIAPPRVHRVRRLAVMVGKPQHSSVTPHLVKDLTCVLQARTLHGGGLGPRGVRGLSSLLGRQSQVRIRGLSRL